MRTQARFEYEPSLGYLLVTPLAYRSRTLGVR